MSAQKKIAALETERDQLYAELRRLQGHNAQHAEAEGVEVVAYVGCQARMTTEGWENGEEYLVFADQASDADKRYDVPLMTVAQHLAALSAVTAERDALAAARMAYANEFAPNENGDPDVGNVHANIRALKTERDQLRAEVETLRKDAERYRWLRDPCSGAEHVIYYSRGDYGRGLMSGSMLDAAIDAALAAKEGQP